MQQSSLENPDLDQRQQTDKELLAKSGLNGFYFVAVVLLFLFTEPAVEAKPAIALLFLAFTLIFAILRFFYYLTLPKNPEIGIPLIYYFSIYASSAVWGAFTAWIISLDPDLSGMSATILTANGAAAAVSIITFCMHRWTGLVVVGLFYTPPLVYLGFFTQADNVLLIISLIGLYIIFLINFSKLLYASYWKQRNAETELKKTSRELEFARNEAIKNNSALEAATSDAKNANLAKTEFLANMSHDIRTPLNGIIGMTEILANTRLDEHQQGYVNTIQESVRLVASLVNDILDYSRINSGKTSIQLHPVSVSALARECIHMLQAQASANNNTAILQDNLPPNCLVRTDRLRIQQVLTNLLHNALKFTQGGIVTVELDLLEKNALYTLSIAVRDTGIGIPEDSLKTIFEAFHQLAKPAGKDLTGIGLGLAICKKLVDLLNGEIKVESVLTEGSCFTINLPVDPPEYQADSISRDLSSSEITNQHSFKLLVVEDNRVNQLVMEAFLEKLGYEFRIVNNGKAALEACQDQLPDLILMDLNLPDLSGQAVTGLIRDLENKSNKRAIIIALTAQAFDNSVQVCTAAGMDDLLTKPVTLAKLKQTLEQWLAPPQSR